jgi:hypothetical protein
MVLQDLFDLRFSIFFLNDLQPCIFITEKIINVFYGNYDEIAPHSAILILLTKIKVLSTRVSLIYASLYYVIFRNDTLHCIFPSVKIIQVFCRNDVEINLGVFPKDKRYLYV